MKSVLLATAITLCTAGLAAAQSSIATAPANGSTGPTIPDADTRKLDQKLTMPNSTSDNPSNWRTSSGLNADPANPDGAPGPSSGLGTSPTRP